MRQTPRLRVLFRAAAGPRAGYGHLVRCGVLAQAMGVVPEVALRGTPSAVAVARRLGCRVTGAAEAGRRLATAPPDLVVIDDPSAIEAGRWVRRARRHAVSVASIHDLGLARVPSDLQIDGSLAMVNGARPADLQGPEFAILDPAIPEVRARRTPRVPAKVLITLGGGAHVRALGARLATRIAAAVPAAAIDIAAGFTSSRRPALPPRCRWIVAPAGLTDALAKASVAVVAGGVTLYEACALGTPTVTFPVTRAQRPATSAAATAGATIDAAAPTISRAMDRAANGVAALLAEPARAAAMGARGMALVDGRGAARVASRLRALALTGERKDRRHVA